MRKRFKVLIGVLLALLLLTGLCLHSLHRSQYGLEVTRYTLTSPKLTAPVRIVQLTDLHNSQFGEENSRLVDLIAAQEPDIIVTTGDMLMRNEEDLSVVLHLTKALAQIAPVYCSMGNHELEYDENFPDADVAAELEQAGANVVHFSWIDTTVEGQPVRVGGLYGYALSEERHNRHGEEQDFLRAFGDCDAYKILLCHLPEGMLLWGGLDDWAVDLTFAGHVHGGVVRLPLVGGLYSQEERWFPSFTAGLRIGAQGSGILSRGLGVSGAVPRFNNVPEVVVAELLPEDGSEN